jgi:gliding motility-associated-like protein
MDFHVFLRSILFGIVLLATFPHAGRTQSPTCDLAQIAATFTGAGYVPLAVQGQPCSVYFVNPNSMSAAAAQAAAEALGANLVVMNTPEENAAVAAALNASQFNGNTIWIGYQRVGAGQNLWFASDGTTGNFPPNNNDPNIYQNWAGGEPNNSGYGNTGVFGSCDYQCENGEQCVQIYPNTFWNDLACNSNSRSVIEVNLCPEINIDLSNNNVCAGTQVTLTATTLLGSTPYNYTWDNGMNGASINVTPPQTTEFTATVVDRYSCSATEIATVSILGSATSDFDVESPACVGVPTAVTYTGTGQSGATYTWDFDGGIPASGTGQGPYQIGWTTPGNKSVTLTVTENGCTSPVTTMTVAVEENPTADFTFTTECTGDETVFTNTSTGNFAASAWDFGSGPVLATDATYTFPSAGTFPVSLGVTTATGCFGTVTQQVTVNPQPTAAFTATDVCLGETTIFTDGSSITGGTIATYAWDFGDNVGTSDQISPSYTYGDADVFDVTLTVTTDQGCTDAVIQSTTVGVLPVADFTVINACAGEPVQFTDATTVSAGSLTGWSWTFGDGGVSTAQNPTRTYQNPGTYDVTLVASSGSCADEVTLSATVYPNPTAAFTTANVCLGEDAVFTDNSSVTGSVIAQWAWEFGNNQIALTQSPSHEYLLAGNYTVTLAVVTADMCTDVTTGNITVYPAPAPAFTAPAVCFGQPTVFTNASTVSSGVISSHAWDFGDESGTSTGQSPSYTYADDGSFPVTLVVTTSFGCVREVTQNVTVRPLPIIDAGHDNILCANQTNGRAFAQASGSSAPYEYQWNDPQQRTTPVIDNLGPGPYTIVVTDGQGCTNDTTVIVAQPLPLQVTVIAGNDTCGIGNGAVQAIPQGGTPPFIYQWSAIRDSSSIFNETDPLSGWNTMLNPGEYTVLLTDSGGCTAQGAATVGQIPRPEAAFITRSRPEELKDPSVDFFNESMNAYSYEWHFGDGNISNVTHPDHDFERSGVYLVMLIARNEPRFGCADTVYKYVEVEPMFTFYVPNAFTPDGDGLNDTWGPQGANFEIESYNVQVYDRWGKLVWQTDNPEVWWNGTLKGEGGDVMAQGVYTYRIIVKYFSTFEPRVITGSVKLCKTR